jgi:hypothetical protein
MDEEQTDHTDYPHGHKPAHGHAMDHAEDHGHGMSHKEVRAAHHAEMVAERASIHHSRQHSRAPSPAKGEVESLQEQLRSTQQQLAAKEEAYNDYVRSSGELEAELELQGKIQEGKIQDLRNELTKNNGGM